MKEIAIRLKELRKESNLSQEELANELGISRQSVISLERGEFLPSLPLIIDILKFFRTPFEQIIECEGINLLQRGGEIEMAREITPWAPIREVSSLHDAIDRMFDDMLPQRMGIVPAVTMPTINMRETDKAIVVEADLPGVKEEDVDIEISDDTLTIKGERKAEQEVKEKDYYRREFSYGSFARSMALPVPVSSDQAEATMKDGVLRVEIPKLQEPESKAKKIKIKK